MTPTDKPMTIDALIALAYSSVGSAHELRAAIEQYGQEREASATSKQVEDCVPAPPFDPAAEPPWHRSDMGPAGRGSGEEPKHGND